MARKGYAPKARKATLPAQVTTHVVPNQLGGDGWFNTLDAQGVAQRHQVWVNEEVTMAVYLIAPDGGPFNWLKSWASTKQEVAAWPLTDWQDQAQVELHVLGLAHQQVREEVGLDAI